MAEKSTSNESQPQPPPQAAPPTAPRAFDAWEWINVAANELTRFAGQEHEQKRRDTVVALVAARLNGTPEEAVWERKEVCSRKVYHQKWKFDPTFADVLNNVTRLARDWKARLFLSDAAHTLAINAQRAADRVVELMESTSGHVALAAAFGLLDRNKETAAKSAGAQRIEHIISNIDYSKLRDDQLVEIANGKDVLTVILDGYRNNSGEG